MEFKRLSTRIQLLLLAALLASALCSGCGKKEKDVPYASEGVIDLRGHDFGSRGSASLSGDWEYYPMKLLSPDDLEKQENTGSRRFARIPGRWNSGWRVYFPSYARGFATYRIRVITGKVHDDYLSLRIPVIQSAYRLYINGKLIHREGNPGTSAGSAVSAYSDKVVLLPPADGVYDIVIQVSNYISPSGGITRRLSIGEMSYLADSRQMENLLSAFLVSALLLLGLYQLLMFSLQRAELRYLHFGIFCWCTMIYSIGLNNSYWYTVFSFLSWPRTYSCMAIAIYMGGAFILAYIRQIFSPDIPRRILYVTFTVNTALSAVMAVIPAEYYAYLLPVLHADIVIIIMMSAFFIMRSSSKYREDAVYVYLGLAIYALTTVFDILSAAGIAPGFPKTAQWGILVICIIQVVGMSRYFIKARHRSLHLAVDNEKLRSLLAGRMNEGQYSITESIEGKINTAIAYLHENFKDDISRENLAAALELHPDSFSRYFRLHTGRKYSEYINELRIKEAIRLISETDDSIISIAMNVGYNSLRTFNHSFLSITGRTPGDFRKAQ